MPNRYKINSISEGLEYKSQDDEERQYRLNPTLFPNKPGDYLERMIGYNGAQERERGYN